MIELREEKVAIRRWKDGALDMLNGKSFAVTNTDLAASIKFGGINGEIGEVMGKVMGGAKIGIPI